MINKEFLLWLLFMACIAHFAFGVGDVRNWQQLKKLIDEAEQSNKAVLDRAMSDNTPANGSMMTSNWSSVRAYLSSLTDEEVLEHAREWIRHQDAGREDPGMILLFCLNRFDEPSALLRIGNEVLNIMMDSAEPSQFRAALIDWLGSRLVNTKEPLPMMPTTTTHLIEILNDPNNPENVRVSAFGSAERLLSTQIEHLITECIATGIWPSEEQRDGMDFISIIADKRLSISKEQRQTALALFSQQKELLVGAESIVTEEELSNNCLIKLGPILRRARISSMSNSLKHAFELVENKHATVIPVGIQ